MTTWHSSDYSRNQNKRASFLGRLLTNILLIAIFSFIAELFLPWWSIAIIAAIIGLLFKSASWVAFWSGFLGIALLWFAYAFFIDVQTSAILSTKIAQLLGVPSSFLLILLTASVGGLVGGMSALTANLFRKIFERRETRYYS